MLWHAALPPSGPMSPSAPPVDWAALADKMVADSAAAVQAAGTSGVTALGNAQNVSGKITVRGCG